MSFPIVEPRMVDVGLLEEASWVKRRESKYGLGVVEELGGETSCPGRPYEANMAVAEGVDHVGSSP